MRAMVGPKGGWGYEHRARTALAAAFNDEQRALIEQPDYWEFHTALQGWKPTISQAMEYYYANIEKSRERCAKEARKRYQRMRHDPVYRMEKSARLRVWQVCKMRGVSKSSRSMELIGCTPDKLRSHLQAQFKQGMAWNNYGKWHVDHIVPVTAFDLSKPEEQRRCFHYTNLQPLWGSDNIRKSNKMDAPRQVTLGL